MKNSRLVISTIYYFVVYLILNYLIFYGFSFTFNIPPTSLYYLILLLVAFSQPFALLLLRFSSNILIRTFYAISALWLGISAYILIFFAVYLISRYFIDIPPQTAGLLIITISAMITVYAVFNATRLKVEELNIPLNINEDDIRAVQISDVHIGPIRNEGFIKKMVDKIVDLEPEIVFITGDLFDGSSKLPDNILEYFNRLKVPILFIMGNHDFYQGMDEIYKFMEKTHITMLNNQIFQFKDLQVVGVPFAWSRGYLKKTLNKIDFNKRRPTVLLYHLPSEFKAAKDAGIDLQLSGHTHAGQFFPFNYFVQLMFPYIRGLYENQGAYLYVSQGTGTLGPPMRWGSSCEITSIHIKGMKH